MGEITVITRGGMSMQAVFEAINGVFGFIGPLSDLLWDFPTITENREAAESNSITMTSLQEPMEESTDIWMTRPIWRRSSSPLRMEIPSSPPLM